MIVEIMYNPEGIKVHREMALVTFYPGSCEGGFLMKSDRLVTESSQILYQLHQPSAHTLVTLQTCPS